MATRKALYELPLPEVWAFGDDLNDIRMLSEVGEEPQLKN